MKRITITSRGRINRKAGSSPICRCSTRRPRFHRFNVSIRSQFRFYSRRSVSLSLGDAVKVQTKVVALEFKQGTALGSAIRRRCLGLHQRATQIKACNRA